MSATQAGAPRLAVVLASCRASDIAAAAIRSLAPQCARSGADLIVARSAVGDSAELLALLAPHRVVRCPPGLPVPEIRGAGLAAADADYVALTEDNCVAAPGWLAALVTEATDADVVGGTMDNARRDRAIDWGAFFAEYGFFGRRRAAARPGQTLLVTGANVAYRRSVLADVAAWATGGAWENTIHDRLAERGARFALAPDARACQNLTYQLGAFCRDRFDHGRAYAAQRAHGASWSRRALLAGATTLLPPLLASRVWRSAGRDAPGAFVQALPATLTFLGAWAVGECTGYLGGSRAHS